MTKQVWKFPLAVINEQIVKLPHNARILAVQPQGDGVCLWALCDVHAEKSDRYIAIVGTGHDLPPQGALKHISTFQLHGGALVFHAFEIVDAFV